ncbi:MAG: hypothetical protein II038_08270, partial [Lachnospiraceae bacterium]|nr:hypothetical protein [Lachnospiraceae bacterium]
MRIAGFPCTSIIPEMLRNISIFKVFRHVLNQKQTLIKLWESIVKTSDSDFRATSVGELFRSKSM